MPRRNPSPFAAHLKQALKVPAQRVEHETSGGRKFMEPVFYMKITHGINHPPNDGYPGPPPAGDMWA